MPSLVELAQAYADQMATKKAQQQTVLDPVQEMNFRQSISGSPWYRDFKRKYGQEPNLNDPQYDYRGAYEAGLAPQRYAPDANSYHWPSSTPDGKMLKSPSHPTAWMEYYMRMTGRDPNAP